MIAIHCLAHILTTKYYRISRNDRLSIRIQSVDESDVAVDALLPISPMKQFVDKAVHDKLRRLFSQQQQIWNRSEQAYIKQIDDLRAEHECQLQAALADREATITELVRENEDNLEAMRESTARSKRDQKTDIDRYAVELEQLRQEVTYLNCAQLASAFLVDEYADALEAGLMERATEIDAITNENLEMEKMVSIYATKTACSKKIIGDLQQVIHSWFCYLPTAELCSFPLSLYINSCSVSSFSTNSHCHIFISLPPPALSSSVYFIFTRLPLFLTYPPQLFHLIHIFFSPHLPLPSIHPIISSPLIFISLSLSSLHSLISSSSSHYFIHPSHLSI